MAQEVRPVGADVTDNDKLMAALAYISQAIVPIIVPLIMLVSEELKTRAYQKYHAVQSLGFFVAVVIYEVIAAVVFVVCSIVTLGFGAFCLWIIFLVPFIPAVYYAYLAYQGNYFDIPVLTNFMVQQKWLERV